MHELIPPTVNFLILTTVLYFVLRKPVKAMILARQQSLKSQVEESRLQKQEAEKRFREFNEKLIAFENEAQQILDRANVEAQAMKAKIISDARLTAERVVKETEATAQANIQDYKDKIRHETIAKAVDLAERIIREGLSKDDQRRIVNEYVGKVQ